MGRLLALTVVHLAYLLAIAIGSERQQHHVQHGPCSFTFILPEVEHCRPSNEFQVTNTLQRDSPPKVAPETSQAKPAKAQKERPSWQDLKLESLESAMENNTQWLQKVLCPTSHLFCLITLPRHVLVHVPLSQTLHKRNPIQFHLETSHKSFHYWYVHHLAGISHICAIHFWLCGDGWCTIMSLYLRPLGWQKLSLACERKTIKKKMVCSHQTLPNVSHAKRPPILFFSPLQATGTPRFLAWRKNMTRLQ